MRLVTALYDVIMFPNAVPFSVPVMELIGETGIFILLNEGETGGVRIGTAARRPICKVYDIVVAGH